MLLPSFRTKLWGVSIHRQRQGNRRRTSSELSNPKEWRSLLCIILRKRDTGLRIRLLLSLLSKKREKRKKSSTIEAIMSRTTKVLRCSKLKEKKQLEGLTLRALSLKPPTPLTIMRLSVRLKSRTCDHLTTPLQIDFLVRHSQSILQ